MKKYNPRNKSLRLEILFTYGKEYMSTDGKEYIGYYYKSGPVHYIYDYKAQENKNTNTLLVEYTDDLNKIEYLLIKNNLFNKFVKPKTSYPIVTKSDYEQGYINRYFVVNKVNQDIIEISEEDYNNVDTQCPNYKKINANLYEPFSIKWKIKGPKQDVYEGNTIIDYGVADTNKRTVLKIKEKFIKITQVLKDYEELSNLF